MEESWKDIKGYEGYYQVSTLGRIKSLERIINENGKYIKPEKILSIKCCWYAQICFSINGIKKTKKIHKIVAEAFIDNPNNKKCVNHKDGNKANNNVSNLEWVTHSENTQHAFDNGLIATKRGKKYPKIK